MTGGNRHRCATERRVRAALLVSGLRWRARSSIAMLAVAVFATGVAAFGPIYLHSADQLVLNRTMVGAAPGNTGLTVRPITGVHSTRWLDRLARSAPEPGGQTRWWGAPILTQSAGFVTIPARPVGGSTASATTAGDRSPRTRSAPARLTRLPRVQYRGTTPFIGSLVARTGSCTHVHIVQGTCPEGDGVAISTRTSQVLGIPLGGSLPIIFRSSERDVSLPVVGIYLPPTHLAPYWWDENYFGYGSFSFGPTGLTNIDAVFATPAGVAHWAPIRRITLMAQVPFRSHTLSVDAVGALMGDVNGYTARLLHDDNVRVSTLLAVTLGGAHEVEHSATTVAEVVDAELVLLGILVLYFVASRTAAEREPDVRLAELRGFRSRSAVSVALAEPIAIVAAAVPLGVLCAWLFVGLVSPSVFGPGVGVSVGAFALVAAIVAGLVGVAAAALGARRSLAGGLSAAADAQPSLGERSRWSVLGSVGVVALAAAAFFELVATGDSGSGPTGTDPLAALAPALLGLALGVVVSELLPGILAFSHHRTAFAPRVATVLATRTVARRREYRSQLVLTALAVALATFAVSGWVIAARNRDQRAKLGVGAPTVLSVSVPTGVTFLGAVRASEPDGHDLMAVMVERASDGTTLAVDARSFAAVATWPRSMGVPASAAATLLVPHHRAPPVRVTGGEVAATVDVLHPVSPAPFLSMDVYDVDTQFASRVSLGRMQPGVHRYVGSSMYDCPGKSGCRVMDLAVTWSSGHNAPTTPSTTIQVRSLAEKARSGRWRPLHAGLSDASHWMGLSGGPRLRSSAGGLLATFTLLNGASIVLAPADVPEALPVIVTPTSSSTASGFGGPLVVGLDGSTLSGHTVATVPSLPQVGPTGVLTDLSTTERYLGARIQSARSEVWVAKGTPPAVIARLGAHDLTVTGEETQANAVARLTHSGLDLAYLLYLLAAVAAIALVAGATAFTLSSAARRRRGELAALRVMGIRAATLRRAVALEQSIVFGIGTLVGVVAGCVSAAVAIRSVPEFVYRTPGLPLQLGLPASFIVVTIGVTVLALAATITIGSFAVVRGARAEHLAGGQG